MRKHVVLLGAACLLAVFMAQAQITDNNPGHRDSDVLLGGPKYKKDKTPTSRFLHGIVTDETNQPVAGALVTLTNNKTNEKLTFITKKDGRYQFEDLSFNIDYVVQARYKNESSDLRKVSQYDRRPDVVRMLELHGAEESAQK